MQHHGEMLCSFCKKSAFQLVTHSLCHCCLVNLECCDASAEKPIPIVPKEDAVRKVECNVCLEECQEDELQHHRMMCMPRWVFRCSVCDGDYLSKEALWNHLALHEIANDSKELHYQEKRVTYKQHKCILCNDQRCYRESIYWIHVHEDHDGFFLRCTGCGENFRSQKLKADHALNHCKHREQIVPTESAEVDVDYAYEINTVNRRHSAQVKEVRCEIPEKQDSHGSKIVGSLSIDIQANDSTVVTDSDDAVTSFNKIVDDKDSSEIKNNDETEEASEEILLSQAEDPSGESSGVKCPHCDKQYASVKCLAHHIGYCHQPTSCDICGLFFTTGNKARYHKLKIHSKMNFKCSECPKEFVVKGGLRRHLISHQVERKFLCKECGGTFKTSAALKRHTKVVHTRYENLQIDCYIPIKKQSKVKKVVKIDCPICRESFNDQNEISQHVQEIHKLSICTICKVTFTSAYELTEHKCTMCSHCGKECYHQMRLKSHIKLCHELIKCDVCETFIPGESQLVYHKAKVHGEPRYKCPHCSKKFHLKQTYQRHMLKYSKIKKFPCELCDRKFKSLIYVIRHMRKIHRIKKARKDLVNYNESNCNDASNDEPADVAFTLESIVEVGETTLIKPEYTSECSSSIENIADHTNNAVARINISKSSRIPNFRGKNKKRKVSRAIGENPSAEPSDTVCPHCDKECYHKSRLINHITWGHDVTECDVCGISFTGKSQVWYHKLTTHSEPKFKCPQCPMKFHLKHSYRRHVSMHDKYSKVFPCKSCGAKFKTLVQLSKHVKQVHFIRKGQTDCTNINKLEKELDGQKFEEISIKIESLEDKSSLQHLDDDNGKFTIQASTMDNPAKCPHCGKKFHQESALSRHVANSHVPTSCEICGITTDNKHKLGYHKRTSHVEPKYKCPHCPEKFCMKAGYERHVSNHGTNKFPCKFCSLMFKNGLAISNHVRQAHLAKAGYTTKVKKN
ncbi:zinc finger protein 729-like [Ochlerotatus camptorhynchus]|uniref:zinc finger protein 729-like n=1 Tax=Ochlerotatus camptorhynchus TaxID=644619 RepID=UPI0031E1A7C3